MRGLRCICMQLCESVLGCVLRECLHLRGLGEKSQPRRLEPVLWHSPKSPGFYRLPEAETEAKPTRSSMSRGTSQASLAPQLSRSVEKHTELAQGSFGYRTSSRRIDFRSTHARMLVPSCSARACTLLTIKSASMLSRQPGSSLHEQVNEVPAHASEDRLAVATLCRYCNLWRHKDCAGQKTARKTHLLCGRLSQPMPRPCILGILEARLHTA